MVTQNKTETAPLARKAEMMTLEQIQEMGGQAHFSEFYSYTLIHVESGKRRFTNRKPSLSYFSEMIAWDNRKNETVPNRSLASARAVIAKAKGAK